MVITYLMIADGLFTGSIGERTTYSFRNTDVQTDFHGYRDFLDVNTYKRQDSMRYNHTTVTTPTAPTTPTTPPIIKRREAPDESIATIDPYYDAHNQQRNHTTMTGELPTNLAVHIWDLSTVKEILPTKDTPAYDRNNPYLISDTTTDKSKRRRYPPKRPYVATSELLHHLAQLGILVLWVSVGHSSGV